MIGAASFFGTPAGRRLLLPLSGVGIIALLALLAPLLPLPDPVQMDVPRRLSGMSAAHPLGQDEYGRDILARLIWGARSTLVVALSSAILAGIIGVSIGLVGGYFGGVTEIFTIRLTDVILSFPPILLALLVVTILGPGAGTLIGVLSLLYTPGFARVTYGETLSARNLEYVEAARALGASHSRILFGTILPNISGPILVQFSLVVASAILIESGLSFLGLGVVPPTPSWGLMIRSARGVMEHNALNLLWPCLALTVTILLVNRACDLLRDAFDPRTAKMAPRGLLAQVAASALNAPGRPPASDNAAMPDDVMLEVRDLSSVFVSEEGQLPAVRKVGFQVKRAETLCIVGESGSGKSVTVLSILGLLPRNSGRVVGGTARFRSHGGEVIDLLKLDPERLRAVRGREIGMVFQEPMTSLNPVWRVGTLIAEAIRAHETISAEAASQRAVKLLDTVGIPDPGMRVRSFPHEMSGGMRQRAMIAMALSRQASLLIADEPTTALDVTIQAQILELLGKLRAEPGREMSVIFITHNFGIVAEIADRVLVMYAGEVVEEADADTIFRDPRHPYTRALLASVPDERKPGGERRPLAAIPGSVPSLRALPKGCAFAQRCGFAEDTCRETAPELLTIAEGHRSRCRRWREL